MKFAGEDGISAYGFIMYVAIVFNAIFMGYSIGSAPIVSFHYGAKDTDELKNLFKKSLVIITISDIFITVMTILFARPLAMIFTSYDPKLLEMTVRASCIYAVAYLFMGMNVWVSSFFTALNNGKVSAFISFLRTFLFQIAAVLILPVIWKLDGVWAAIVVAEMLAVIVTVSFLAVKRKQYQY